MQSSSSTLLSSLAWRQGEVSIATMQLKWIFGNATFSANLCTFLGSTAATQTHVGTNERTASHAPCLLQHS